MGKQDQRLEQQITLMSKQDAAIEEQLAIVKRQDETTRLLISRKSRPEIFLHGLAIKPTPQNPSLKRYEFVVSILNHGKRSLDGFYYHLLVPMSFEIQSTTNSLKDITLFDEFVVKNVRYHRFRRYIKDPVFPSRLLDLGNLALLGPNEPQPILWRIETDDGMFPPDPDAMFSEIELNSKR